MSCPICEFEYKDVTGRLEYKIHQFDEFYLWSVSVLSDKNTDPIYEYGCHVICSLWDWTLEANNVQLGSVQ